MSRIPVLFIFMFVIATRYQVNSFVATIGDIATVSNFANDALSFAKGELPLKYLIMGSTGHAIDTILEKLDGLSSTLEQMEANNERRMDVILQTLLNRLPLETKLTIGFNELQKYISRIDAFYLEFLNYKKLGSNYSEIILDNLVNVIVFYGEGDLWDTVNNLQTLTSSDGPASKYRDSLQEIISQKDGMLTFDESCGLGSSPQQRLYELYQLILVSESRAFLMTMFGYTMLRMLENETMTVRTEVAAAQFVNRAQSLLETTKAAMVKSSLVLENCDATSWERGKNFVELEKAIQMYVLHKDNIYQSSGKSCDDIKYSSGIDGTCTKSRGHWCPRHPCNGQLVDCSSGSFTEICETWDNSSRRYDYIKHKDNDVYGNADKCSGIITSYSVSDTCFCTCVEYRGTPTTIRTINMRSSLSNIEENKVVTGVRFIESDGMIHLQVEEGELIAGDHIKPDSLKWVEPEKFEFDPEGAVMGQKLGSFKLKKENKEKIMTIAKDFLFITTKHRIIYLDELKAPSNYVITGVKFQSEKRSTDISREIYLQLAIRVTKFDFTTGTLDLDEKSSYWLSQENHADGRPAVSFTNRKRIDLSNSNNPTKVKNNKITFENQYVLFTTTDRKLDAGQTTIPLFDGQDVTPAIRFPLSGMSLVHRGAPGSGGFLTFRLLTLNLPEYLKTNLNPSEFPIDTL